MLLYYFCMRLYNTIHKKIDHVYPIEQDTIKMYVCGPTVYDDIHLGNARAFVVFDQLYRILKHCFKHVIYVRNITDVDDKIIIAAKNKDISIDELTTQTNHRFQEAMSLLNVLSPTIQPKATEHIDHMIRMIITLIDKGHAYIEEGHVLFSTSSYGDYGGLSQKSLDDLIAGARVEVAPYKKDPTDFVLWKPSHGDDIGWNSPFGFGRPGWHLECSAMSHHYLGKTFDIHGGGIDLIFPHHDNEIAQSCCAFSVSKMANIWVHNGHLMVNHQKMSKSLGNFITVWDLLNRYPSEVIRLALLMTHYRHPLNWQHDSTIDQAHNIYEKIKRSLDYSKHDDTYIDTDIIAHLQDDLNTPLAIQRLIHLSQEKSPTLLASAQFLGLFCQTKIMSMSDQDIESWIQKRHKAKTMKNFQEADRIRAFLKNQGIILEDTKDQTIWFTS